MIVYNLFIQQKANNKKQTTKSNILKTMASYQMFIDLKQSILKEIASKLESKKLMTDSLKIFFFDEIFQGVNQTAPQASAQTGVPQAHRQMTDSEHSVRVAQNARQASAYTEHPVRVTQSNQKEKKQKHQKRPATEHQKRVSHCMKLVRERYPEVRHQLCLGASQYMLSYLKENNCLDFSNESVVNEAIVMGAMKMNDKRGEVVFKTLKKSENKEEKQKPEEEEDSDDSESESSDSEPDDMRLASQSDSSDDEGFYEGDF